MERKGFCMFPVNFLSESNLLLKRNEKKKVDMAMAVVVGTSKPLVVVNGKKDIT